MNRSELERIYDEHAACAFALFRRFAQGESDARDLLQDWLIKISQSIDSLSDIKNERSFLLRIAYRQAVDWSRKSDTRKKYDHLAGLENAVHVSEFVPEIDPDREMLRRSLEKSLATLPHDQQLAVQLKLWDELTFSEIGVLLGISANTVASRYRYGIEKLQNVLQPIYDELCA